MAVGPLGPLHQEWGPLGIWAWMIIIHEGSLGAPMEIHIHSKHELQTEVCQLRSDLIGAKCQIEALEDMQEVERSRHQLAHQEKKQKPSHWIKLAVEGEVVTHEDFLNCVARVEAGKLEKDAQKQAAKDCHTQGKRIAAVKGASANIQAQAWEVAKKRNEAVELQWKEEITHWQAKGGVLPKKPDPLKRKDVWAALEGSGNVPEGESKPDAIVDDESSSESDGDDHS
ncbi:hypothetical protein BS47DRAFT_1363142 [Hydnum rufescens UP504]|uniref:Uncharacterized protein n=1 Tax=Hydnum rufescens UP504 TaxID=1448309 RepID=A0A9P6AV15_9AGAM|nr:hypothetical protein BS47DRAFT_1363142 [Hydnum rufescens UP504]